MYYTCLLLLIKLYLCHAYKVLVVFPIPWKSHYILGEATVWHLVKAGHEVTYLTPSPIENAPKGLRQIDISASSRFFPKGRFDIVSLINKKGHVMTQEQKIRTTHDYLVKSLELDNVQNFINDSNEQYDVVVVEWLHTETMAGFASLFNCPLIWVSTMEAHTLVLSLIDEHLNPNYNVLFYSTNFSRTFWNRAKQLWSLTKILFYTWYRQNRENEDFKNIFGSAILKRGRELPYFRDVKYNASLMFGNSDVVTGDAISLPQNYIHIGGYHIKEPIEPSPSFDLKGLMDESSNGVIYYSLGSSLNITRIPRNLKKGILESLGEVDQTVILKMDHIPEDQPKNVHTVPWAPQQYILAHPNCKLFITHGGQLSIIETLYFGIPIIGIPLFADQYNNVNRAVAKGFGKQIDFNSNTPEVLKNTIKEMMTNSSYRATAKHLSSLFIRSPTPGQRLVKSVELVARTGGAQHLRSVALHVPLYQKLYLDLILVFIIGVLGFLFVITYLYHFVTNIRRPKTLKKKDKRM